LIALAQGCHYLTVIGSLCGKGITDRAIRALADGCPHHRHLCLTSTSPITAPALVYLLQRCVSLREVQVKTDLYCAEVVNIMRDHGIEVRCRWDRQVMTITRVR
jgi:hypothetical protein